MAAFTTMALMGAAAAGGMFAAKKLAPKPRPIMDVPDNAALEQTLPAPPVATDQLNSDAAAAANVAGMKRRRMASGLGVMGARPSRRMRGRAVIQAPALIGGAAPRPLVGY